MAVFTQKTEKSMIQIRAAQLSDSRAIGKVQVDSWRSAYRDIMPAAYLAKFTDDEQEADWREILSAEPKPLVLVAETDVGEIVGFAYGVPEGIEGYQSELSILHLSPNYRGQGIGRQLFAEIAKWLRAMGCQSLFVWTLKDNAPARRFYERLGGQLFSEKTSEIGKDDIGFFVTDVGYGWPDIDTLCDLTAVSTSPELD